MPCLPPAAHSYDAAQPSEEEPMLESFTALLAAGAPSGEITSLYSGAAIMALVTLTVLEIVLGIDNIIFISVLADKLPKEQQNKARTMGLALAMIMRILLLLSISWIMRFTTPVPVVGEWFTFATGDDKPLNWRDTILL